MLNLVELVESSNTIERLLLLVHVYNIIINVNILYTRFVSMTN